ncbi:NtaA/DmoA family FMN-dependent monooxygenase [Nakamurella leprariae]|uniref:NtaA/DmoA family FMN-dependent monooxygenase n=1 Tax=Nakamurella leprariae TaxID=2803911 RepID=A0A938YEY2_9ACTN|nr:NtaA/DmoA family FMN-dependent monooxygenase [Nakamurella leprariae]MBM9469457.1 NtaA/DmoA family FMN-dependent monooxygenase [Nakamurella leprariae]
MFHMGWFLTTGFGVYGWGGQWSGNVSRDVARPELFMGMAQALEHAGFDYMMLEDSSVLPDIYEGSPRMALKTATVRHDPMPLVPLIARATKHIGVIATAATTFYPPFLAARLFTTLDHLTGGRVGINLVTASPHAAAQNYGLDQHVEHDLRYEMADEWMQAVSALWETWEEGALQLDEQTGVFADHSKIHRADFQGRFYKTRGPLNTVPGPQRRPVICQAGGSPAGRELAAAHADTIVAAVVGVEAMKEYRDDISRRLIAHGRKPQDAKVMFLVNPVLGDTDAEAQAKYDRMVEARAANVEGFMAGLSYTSGIDLSQYDPDEPFPDLTGRVNGHQSTMQDYQDAAAGGKTWRQVARERAVVESVPLVGSPATVAAQMDEAMQHAGGDGFLIANPVTRKSIAEIADGLAPQLRRRGLIRSGYSYDRFRDNLLEF